MTHAEQRQAEWDRRAAWEKGAREAYRASGWAPSREAWPQAASCGRVAPPGTGAFSDT